MSKRWANKTIVGLTGNIATGKSAVMRMAAEQGALFLDADKIVHEIMDHDSEVQTAIVDTFGPQVCRPDGRINRAVLGDIVFNDPEALRKLEKLIHPAVRRELLQRIEDSQATIAFVEAIKLLEGGLAQECDHIWVTRCPRLNQIERLMVCRGMDVETAVLRINAQSPQEEKVARADVVIDTDGTMADTRAQFEAAWSRLVEMSPAFRPADSQPQPMKRPEPEPAPMETQPEPRPRKVPQRLTAEKAAELRQRLKPKAEAAVETRPSVASDVPLSPVTVRRARPSDVPSILLLIQRATNGAVKMKRADLLLALGERSYFIGQSGTEISTILGWNSENLVARIDQIYIHPLEAAPVTGPAVLAGIEDSANRLICEAILAFPPKEAPLEIRQLFESEGYTLAKAKDLPSVWQSAAEDSQPENTDIMLKVLRETRITQPL